MNELSILPIVATENQQASKARICPMRSYADLGVFTSRSCVPKAEAIATSTDRRQGELVCQAGRGEAAGVKA